jgi:hypothetical protein
VNVITNFLHCPYVLTCVHPGLVGKKAQGCKGLSELMGSSVGFLTGYY